MRITMEDVQKTNQIRANAKVVASEIEKDVPNQVEKLIVALKANFAARNIELNRPDMVGHEYQVIPGQKYYKIIYGQTGPDGFEQASVHAFVDKKNGDLYKASSWKAPAKGVRFNLYTDMKVLEKLADTYGGYLYKGSRCSEAAIAAQLNNRKGN